MSEKEKKIVQEKPPTMLASVVIFIAIIAIIMWGAMIHGLDVQVLLLIGTGITIIYGVVVQKIKYHDIEKSMISSITDTVDALLVIMSIGMLIGTWIACGTIPYVIYLGLGLINPAIFLPFVAIMGGILSSITGSSWVCIGTIGIAFLGIATGLGIPLPITAGAILCGAYFGDKISPISGDAPNFFAAVSRVDLYRHCYMSIYSTGPTFLASIVVLSILGAGYGTSGSVDNEMLATIRDGLASVYHFSPLLWLPIIFIVAVTALKFDALPSIASAAFVGFFIAWFYQGVDPISGLKIMFNGYVGETGIEAVDGILSRGGLNGMMYTVGVVLCAMMMAGALVRTGLLHKIISKVDRFIRKDLDLSSQHFFTGLALCFACADTFFSCTIVAKAYDYKYDELHIDRTALSRTLGDFATTCCPLVPWSINGVFCATTMGVSVAQFAPYYFMAVFAPIMVIIIAATGFGIRYINEDGEYVKKLPANAYSEA